jgi:hypothetical protein
MQTKTYFASSVPAALDLARKELGEDALLVTSKPSPPAMRAFGRRGGRAIRMPRWCRNWRGGCRMRLFRT